MVSHDLQEPLRKIHLFSEEILKRESGNFSTKSKEYFERLISASDRMSELINALLNYSRLTREEMTSEKTNLADIIEEVKTNLYDIIEEKNALILTENLPSLYVEPVQFYQLFSNLVDNSIKYSRKNIQPVIIISAKLLENCNLKKDAPPTNYWKITYTDNGIGFDPGYSEKIFEVFNRLHCKSEYPGTGIGLAICKKVVENHNGIITANGDSGKGAMFHIFIPAAQTDN
jgi:light-regulated signal transduction histidine kinase (bacteriophytochrome)